ncbi:hypothetical protein [Rhodanobacter lindaniclasticus]
MLFSMEAPLTRRLQAGVDTSAVMFRKAGYVEGQREDLYPYLTADFGNPAWFGDRASPGATPPTRSTTATRTTAATGGSAAPRYRRSPRSREPACRRAGSTADVGHDERRTLGALYDLHVSLPQPDQPCHC